MLTWSGETAFNEGTNKSSVDLYYSTERDGHDKGNYTAYDEAIRQVWLVMTGFANNSTTSTQNSTYLNGSAEGSLRCIRADKFTNGSRMYENMSPGQDVLMEAVFVAALLSLSIIVFT